MHKKITIRVLTLMLSLLSFALNAQTTNGLQLWLKPEGLTNTVTSSPISFWTDSSGAGYHATNGTGAQRPTLTLNALNGHSVAHFTGDGLVSANLNYLQSPLPFNATTNPFTTIIVYKSNFAGQRNQIIHQVGGYAMLYVLTNSSPMATNLVSNASGVLVTDSVAYAPATWKIITLVEDASTLKMYDGGTLVGTATIGATAASTGGGWVFGARQDKTRFGFNGEIAEVLVYNTNLGDADRSAAETYLANKYALPVSQVVLADDFNNPQTGSAAPQGYGTGGGPVSIGGGTISMNNSSPSGGYDFYYATCNLNLLPYETAARVDISFDITNLAGAYTANPNDSWASFSLSQYFAPGGPVTDWGFIIRTNGTGAVFAANTVVAPVSVTPTNVYHVNLSVANGQAHLLINGVDQGTSTILCPLTWPYSYMSFGMGTVNNGAVSVDFANFIVSQTMLPSPAPLSTTLKLTDNFNSADSPDINAGLARQSGTLAPMPWNTNGLLNTVLSINGNALLMTNSPGGGAAIGMAAVSGDLRQYEHLNSFRIRFTVTATNDATSNDSWIGIRFRDNAPSHFVADADGGGTGINFFTGDGRWYLWQSFLGLTNTSAVVQSGSATPAGSYAFEFDVRTNVLRIKINGQPQLLGCGTDTYQLTPSQVNNFITLQCLCANPATAGFAKFDDFTFESLDTGLTVAAPTIINPAYTGSAFRFSLNSVNPIFYAVDSKADLATSTWNYLGGFVGNGGVVSYTNNAATNNPQFYRLRVP